MNKIYFFSLCAVFCGVAGFAPPLYAGVSDTAQQEQTDFDKNKDEKEAVLSRAAEQPQPPVQVQQPVLSPSIEQGTTTGQNGGVRTYIDPQTGDIVTSVTAPRQAQPRGYGEPVYVAPQIEPYWPRNDVPHGEGYGSSIPQHRGQPSPPYPPQGGRPHGAHRGVGQPNPYNPYLDTYNPYLVQQPDTGPEDPYYMPPQRRPHSPHARYDGTPAPHPVPPAYR